MICSKKPSKRWTARIAAAAAGMAMIIAVADTAAAQATSSGAVASGTGQAAASGTATSAPAAAVSVAEPDTATPPDPTISVPKKKKSKATAAAAPTDQPPVTLDTGATPADGAAKPAATAAPKKSVRKTAAMDGASAPPEPGSKCKTRSFLVNDYGKDGPTADAKRLLDQDISDWSKANNLSKVTVGTKSVTCEQFLNFIVFDEWTCTATAKVCWQ